MSANNKLRRAAQHLRRRHMLVRAAIAVALLILTPIAQASAAPPEVAGNVSTAVYVVMHKSFTTTVDADQCLGAGDLATIRRGSWVFLSEGSPESSETPKVAVGQHYRSRLSGGKCEALYITSAPVLPVFNVQFAGAEGEVSPTFGPVASQPVTDQPGIQQVIRVDLGVEPQP